MSSTLFPLSREQIEHFQTEGYVALPPIASEDELARLRTIYDRLFAEQAGREEGNQFDLGGTDEEGQEAVLPQILNPKKYAPELEESPFRAKALSIAQQLLGTTELSVGEHAFLKPARYGAATPWHQDEAYWSPLLEYHSLSLWMPLQEATEENGCMQFVPRSNQLGVQISLQAIETFNTDTDPFTQSDAGELLRELSDYRVNSPTQTSFGLTHLYTGRDLDGTTVGIAWTGALCSANFGTGLSEGNGTATFDSLIAAHEIGHNFGSPHDGEAGSACESQAGDWLMSPRLNGSNTFSPCSITEMDDDIRRASCITGLPSVDMRVSLQSSATILFGTATDLRYEVFNNGTLDAANVSVDFTMPATVTLGSVTAASGTCTTGTGTVNCVFGDIPGSAVRAVDITVTPNALGAGTISATVSADNDDRPENNEESLQLMVDPAVDLVAGTPSGASVRVNKRTTITSTLENRATLDATGVTLTIDVGDALRTEGASWSLGTCSVLAQRVTCQAATFPALSSSTINVDVNTVSVGNPNITVTLESNEADIAPNDNLRNGRLEVREAKDDSGSGSTGPLFLLLLGLVAMMRRRV
mgnify:CR=1 FL=1